MDVRLFDISDIPCKCFLPDDGVVDLAVLAVHGFAGDKESSAIAALAAELCARDRAAVYCFDFPAHGAHPSDELSVAACEEALCAVAHHISRKHPRAQKAVFATSFGGYMALRCTDELSRLFGSFSLVLRAPAVKMAETLEGLLGEDGLAQLDRVCFVESGFERMIMVRKEFIEELWQFDACRPYDRPMLVIHGDKDDVVKPTDIATFMGMNPSSQLVQIPGVDHRFKGEGELEAVVAAARDYLTGSTAVR